MVREVSALRVFRMSLNLSNQTEGYSDNRDVHGCDPNVKSFHYSLRNQAMKAAPGKRYHFLITNVRTYHRLQSF